MVCNEYYNHVVDNTEDTNQSAQYLPVTHDCPPMLKRYYCYI